MSPLTKRVAFFLIGVVGLGAVLMWPWPAVQVAYGRAFTTVANGLIGWSGQAAPHRGMLGSSALAQLRHAPDNDPERDLQIAFLNLRRIDEQAIRQGRYKTRRLSSRHLGFMPTATVAALILATPIPWRRRAVALLGGLLVMQVFVITRFAMLLLREFYGTEPHAIAGLPPWLDRMLDLMFRVLVVVPAPTYLVPLVVWLALCVRSRDLRAWAMTAPDATAPPRPGPSKP